MAANKKSTMVSVQGDRQYIHTLDIIARKHGTTMAKLVRAALDNQYGAEIAEAAVFFASDGTQNYQNKKSNTVTEANHAA